MNFWKILFHDKNECFTNILLLINLRDAEICNVQCQ